MSEGRISNDYVMVPRSAFDRALEYFEQREDASTDSGDWRGNEEMSIAGELRDALATPSPSAAEAGLTNAARDVLAERRRQVEREGWTAAHDDVHDDRELARAAAAYLNHYVGRMWVYECGNHDDYQAEPVPDEWPWGETWWKPKDPRRDLVRAAALIFAEIERYDRAATKDAPQ